MCRAKFGNWFPIWRPLGLFAFTAAKEVIGSSDMKAQDRYLMFVHWSEQDQLYVGYCPDLFPAGGVCHGATSVEAYGKLCEIVEDTVKTSEE